MKRPKPQSAADCRALIAESVIKPRIVPARLEALYKCLRMFERVEKQRRDDPTLAALAEQNRIEQEKLEVKKAEYRRRALNTSSGSIITFNLEKEVTRLKQRIASLETELSERGVQSTETRSREQ